MSAGHAIRVRYWGATGSLAVPFTPAEIETKLVAAVQKLLASGALARLAPDCDEIAIRDQLREHVPFELRSTYGRNNTCIELETRDDLLIVDAGSGLRDLGTALERRWSNGGGARQAHLLVTHSHLDHLAGLPFFEPAYNPQNRIVVWGAPSVLDNLQAVLGDESSWCNQLFPATLSLMGGIAEFRPIPECGRWNCGETTVRTLPLSHPGGCHGYRIENGGRAVVVATDHEPDEDVDLRLAEFARHANLLYADAQYTQAEYDGREGIGGRPPKPRVGWGHGTIERLVRTAVAGQVHRLHLGHHEPQRNDLALARIEAYARRFMHETSAQPIEVSLAREGWEGLF